MVWYLKLNLLNNTIKSIWGKLGIQLTGFRFTFPLAVSKIVRAASGWANMRFTRVWATFICNKKKNQYWSFILPVNRQVICSLGQMAWVVSKKVNVFVTLHSQLLHTPLRLQKTKKKLILRVEHRSAYKNTFKLSSLLHLHAVYQLKLCRREVRLVLLPCCSLNHCARVD